MRTAVHPEFPEYLIRENGEVVRAVDSRQSQRAGSILLGRVLDSGYRQHKLVDDTGTRREIRTNRLVLESFVGPPPTDQHHGAHRDGIRLNNHIDNLYWATPQENKHDSIAHGTAVRGERTANQHGRAKMTKNAVLRIRNEYRGIRGQLTRFSEEYGVGLSCISKIIRGETWGHL